ncbi:hypothetical protein N9115_00330 [bacterium]|nr:hypothetical protein [bacterium]MDB4577094.1 hypothetical protein [bacterium]
MLPSVLNAQNQGKPLPKFEELLPTEHFFNKEPISVGHTYGFMTNKGLKELKELLLAKLGDGWEFEIAPPEVLKDMNKGRGPQYEEIGSLSHKDFEKYSIGVTLVKTPATFEEELKGFTYMLSIVTVDTEIARKLEEQEKQNKTQ